MGTLLTRAPWRVAATFAIGLTALLALGGGPVSAHNYLVSSTPAPGAVVTEPLGAVTLEFSDVVLSLATNTSFVEVTDAAGTHFETECATTVDRVVTTPIALGAAGEYSIVWQIVSADGHVVSDLQTFTYQPAAGVSAAVGSASAACPSAVTGSESGSADGPLQVAPETASAGSNVVLIISIAGGIVLLALIGVGVVLLLARSKRDSSE